MLRFVLYFCASLFSLAAAKAEDAPIQQVPAAAQPPPAATPAPAPAPVAPAPIAATPEALKAEPPKPNLNRYAIGAFIAGQGTASFNNAFLIVGADSYVGTVGFDTASGYGIMLEYDRTPKGSWGLQAGFSYELPRAVTSVTANFNGKTVTEGPSSGSASVQISEPYINAVYRWDLFYIPFGLNYSLPVLSGGANPVVASGGIGAQLGIGFQVSEWSAIELVSHVSTLRITAYDGTNSLDYGSGYVSDFRIQAKFSFK